MALRNPLRILTKRECEVLQLLAEGKSNRGVSEALYISEKTVKNHVSSILQKMNVTDRTQADVHANRNGWVDVCYDDSDALWYMRYVRSFCEISLSFSFLI